VQPPEEKTLVTRLEELNHAMFPLDILAKAVPAYRLAGRFGMDAFGLLWPRSANLDEGIRLFPLAGATDAFDPEVFFRQERPLQVSRAMLRNHALLAHPRGEFFSTDKLALSEVKMDGDDYRVGFSVTHFENPNGEPAPRDLYVVLSVEFGDSRPQSLTLHFSGLWRNFRGEETTAAEPAASPLRLNFLVE